jgi:hypothetical protein
MCSWVFYIDIFLDVVVCCLNFCVKSEGCVVRICVHIWLLIVIFWRVKKGRISGSKVLA